MTGLVVNKSIVAMDEWDSNVIRQHKFFVQCPVHRQTGNVKQASLISIIQKLFLYFGLFILVLKMYLYVIN